MQCTYMYMYMYFIVACVMYMYMPDYMPLTLDTFKKKSCIRIICEMVFGISGIYLLFSIYNVVFPL